MLVETASPRAIAPWHAFGVNPRLGCPVVPLVAEELSFVACVESTLAFVCGGDEGQRVGRPMQFFPLVTRVTTLAFHQRKKLLASCATGGIVYSIGTFNGSLVPGVMAKLEYHEEFSKAAFSPDSIFLVCVTRLSNTAVGYEWRTGRVTFAVNIENPVANLAYHPTDSLELSTCGPRQHLRLWRLLHKRLKPRPPIDGLRRDDCFTFHAWLENATELLAAGTRDGTVVVVQQNKLSQRFDRVHGATVRAVHAIEGGGFATVCEDGVACVFVQSGETSSDGTHKSSSRPRASVQVARRVALGLSSGVYAVALFPRSTVSLVCCRDGLATLDFADLLPNAPSSSCSASSSEEHTEAPVSRLGSRFHESPIVALSAAQRIPLVASCSAATEDRGGNCICVWDWQARTLVARHAGDTTMPKKRLVGVDLHPGGHQLLAGFAGEVALYHVAYEQLLLDQSFQVRGVVSLKRDATPLVATTDLSIVKYSRGGNFFVAVLGRLVEVFATIAQAGRAGLVHCLCGHASDVRAVAWGPDNLTIWTASDDGAVYEWSVGAAAHLYKIVNRTKDFVRLGVAWQHLAAFVEDGALVAAGRTRTALPADSIKKKSTSSESENDDANSRAVVTVWTDKALDAHATDLPLPDDDRRVTSVVTIDASNGLAATLVIGTSRGSVLVYQWNLVDHKNGSAAATEIPLCGGSVAAMTFCCNGDRLCVTGVDGSVLVCTASRKFKMAVLDNTDNCESECEMLLAERSFVHRLEDQVVSLTMQLEETKQEVRKRANEMAPAFRREIEELQHHYQSQLQARDADLDASHASLDRAKEKYEAQLCDIKKRFDAELAELEMLYERKLAIEAARYTEIQVDRDAVALEAREQAASLKKSSQEDLDQLRRETHSRIADGEREVGLLKEYLQHAKHHFHQHLEEQDKHHDLELVKAKCDKEKAIVLANQAKHNLLRDNARIKQSNMELKELAHRNRDDLIECQQALINEQKRNDAQAKQIEDQKRNLAAETTRADRLEHLANQQGQKLKELEQLRTMLSQQKDVMKGTIHEKDTILEQSKNTLKRLDAILEEAGLRNKTLEESIQRKVSELRRVTKMLNDCRTHMYAKDKSLSRVREFVDVLLLKLRNPEIRPAESVVTEIKTIRDSVAKVQAIKPKDDAIAPPEQARSPPRLRPVSQNKVRQKPTVGAIDVQHDLEKQTMDKLRNHNVELMGELNDLRFDRLSLRRKLRDARFQIRWGRRAITDDGEEEEQHGPESASGHSAPSIRPSTASCLQGE
ncbi:hypothetical protein CTAYLR_007014 [Chrysophaeum taylorii]|uniref:Cilia- and flagella-associated protein 57 n=1 Tax=Chrysophaeum taylorii TaxID=2483200 RepID=A0AAD7U9B1_9STRA|nr:hypothetical protein CTAYLR_007014 [Chrysophaeum taylorii]